MIVAAFSGIERSKLDMVFCEGGLLTAKPPALTLAVSYMSSAMKFLGYLEVSNISFNLSR
jgi:FMN-dependent NADH-azoreductase